MMEADNCLQDVLFTNRVAEIKDEMAAWQQKDIHVYSLHHWPGTENIADLATTDKATLSDVTEHSDWQRGPVQARYPLEKWPVNRDFV